MDHFFGTLGILGASFLGLVAVFWRFYIKPYPNDEMEYIPLPEPQNSPIEPVPALMQWDTPQHAFHSVRVLCDEADLTIDEKNLICACIYQESQFKNTAKNANRSKITGAILSTDWGLCQVNDFYHIGQDKDFPSVDFVLNNPAEVVNWMISMYKHGELKMWVSFSSGAYKKWLSTWSPMWLLKLG